MGLYQLGQTQAANFNLQIIFENRNAGSLGIFLGYRTRREANGDEAAWFHGFVQDVGGTQMTLLFFRDKLNRQTGRIDTQKTWLQQDFPVPKAGAHQLGIHVRRGVITRLFFDETNVTNQMLARDRPSAEALAGPLGVFQGNGSALIRAATFTYFSEEQ